MARVSLTEAAASQGCKNASSSMFSVEAAGSGAHHAWTPKQAGWAQAFQAFVIQSFMTRIDSFTKVKASIAEMPRPEHLLL